MKWKVGDKFKYENRVCEITSINHHIQKDEFGMTAKEPNRIGHITVFTFGWENRIQRLNSDLIKERLGLK